MTLREFIDRTRLKYNLKREYFTLLVPIAIAVLVVVSAITSGLAGLPSQEVTKDEKQLAYEELVKQLAQEEGGDAAVIPEETAPKTPPLSLDMILIIGTLIAITPYAIDITLQKRRLRKKEETFTEFLFKLSELMRGGLDPIKSIVELSKTDLGELTPHIQLAATSMTFGKSFEESMRIMSESLNSTLIKRYTELVITASYSGGAVADLILRSSEDMRSILSIEREKEGNLSQYTFIFYFAQGIVVFIAYTLATSLLPYLQGIGAQTMFGANEIANLDFARGFFHLIIINAFFGGLIIGKITEGEARFGLKHASILIIACTLAGVFFILPPPSVEKEATVTIELVSGGDQQAIAGFSLRDPLEFKVLNLDGTPASRADIQFFIKPSGTVSPVGMKTTRDGTAMVKVTLGPAGGTYTVTASSEGAKLDVQIVAVEM